MLDNQELSKELKIKLWRIIRPGFAIRLKFADSSIICVWTYKKLPRIICFYPDLNIYILDEYLKAIVLLQVRIIELTENLNIQLKPKRYGNHDRHFIL